MNECIACAKPLNASARICSECRSYQKPWKNVVVFFGKAVGLLGLLGSLALFLAVNSMELYEEHIQRGGLLVLSYRSDGAQVYRNTDSHPVLISHVELSSPAAKRFQIDRVQMKIGARSIEVRSASPPRGEEEDGDNSFDVIWLEPDQDTASVITAAREAEASSQGSGPCFAIQFYAANDPAYLMIADTGERHQVRPAETEASATFYYYKAGERDAYHGAPEPETVEIPAKMLVVRNRSQECRAHLEPVDVWKVLSSVPFQ